MRTARKEEDYAIDAGLRLLKVLEALEGTRFEAVSIERVRQRCGDGFSYDFVRRALITLKLAGFAAEVKEGWTAGPKVMRFGTNFNEVCLSSFAPPHEFRKFRNASLSFLGFFNFGLRFRKGLDQ